jgi:feruloyl esterase
VVRNLSTQANAPAVDDFYHLFLVPGMLHCHFGSGDAPWFFGAASGLENLGSSIHSISGFEDAEHDAMLALMKWVEEDVALSWIVGTEFVNDSVPLGVRRQRKICPYPGRARFIGGDVDASESWEC